PHTTIRYTGGARGWAGDVPAMSLSTQKLAALGWAPRRTSEDAIRHTIRVLLREL
ncbi:MAG: UDP-glucose 4-epimerase, partial [Candidatus Bathyarchaeota archaeon]